MESKDERERREPTSSRIDNEGGILSEESLRQLSKSISRLIPKDSTGHGSNSIESLQRLVREILRTVDHANLSKTHSSAALNSLCGVLEQSLDSCSTAFQALAFSKSTWTQAFNVFIARADGFKVKPARRLLLVLTKILVNFPTGQVRNTMIGHAVYHTTDAILKESDFASVKPAVQVLEQFISKGIVSALAIIDHELLQARSQLSKDLLEPADRIGNSLSKDQLWNSIDSLISNVLSWIQYPDCAPAAGRFLAVFFRSMQEEQTSEMSRLGSESQLWITPMKQFIARRTDLFESFEHYVLPAIFSLDFASVTSFIDSLPFHDIGQGIIRKHSVTDLQLCLSVAKYASAKSRTCLIPLDRLGDHEQIRDVGDHSQNDQHTPIDSERLAISLLDNLSSNIRIAALSLLLSSTASTTPIPCDVFSHLRRVLPFFHIKVTTKSRNEFIGLMKKFCTRLRGAIMSIERSISTSNGPEHQRCAMLPSTDTKCSDDDVLDSSDVLRHHLAFRRWYLLFLVHELRPTASYQSHITALKILHLLLADELVSHTTEPQTKLNRLPTFIRNIPHVLLSRPLLDLLLDPFDDVRQTAASILGVAYSTNAVYHLPLMKNVRKESEQANPEISLHDANCAIQNALDRAETKLERTGRADHADGVARLYELLYRSRGSVINSVTSRETCISVLEHLLYHIENEVRMSQQDLLTAVSCTQIQGHLIALRYIISQSDTLSSKGLTPFSCSKRWREFHHRMVVVCEGVWEAVREILCFDAPEGYEMDQSEVGELEIESKDTLSFCWRALKESSSIIHTMMTSKGYSSMNNKHLYCFDDYRRLGNLAFTQLAELRHRGAFSTVAQTFAACCTACITAGDQESTKLPKMWYQDALACLHQSASKLTRRSAGLPSMIVGILAAFPTGDFFAGVIGDLQTLAKAPMELDCDTEKTKIPQVHALNCLKDVFTDARLAPSTETHVAKTLEIAASTLESGVWALRNCGLMLFKALLKRLNGGTDIASTKVSSSHRRFSQLTYQKYRNLPTILLNLLRNTGRSPTTAFHSEAGTNVTLPAVQKQSLFAALEVIERSGVPSQNQAEVLDIMWCYAGSSDWHIREKAARALSLIIEDQHIQAEVPSLLSPDWKSQNILHGRLLCLRSLLTRTRAPFFCKILRTYETLLPMIMGSWHDLVEVNKCPITVATYLEIVADMYEVLMLSRSSEINSFVMQHRDDMKVRWAHHMQGTLSRNKDKVLEIKALARCLSLQDDMIKLSAGNATSGKETVESIDASQCDLNTFVLLSRANMPLSDDEILANMQELPACHFQHLTETTHNVKGDYGEPYHNPQKSCLQLAMLGYNTGRELAATSLDGRMEQRLATWVYLLRSAGSEDSDLCRRMAAASSIKGFFTALHESAIKPNAQPKLLAAYLALYDILIDDDEDVRDQGATVVSLILSSNEDTCLSLSPPAAQHGLLDYLIKGYHHSYDAFTEAVRRVTGATSHPELNSNQSRQGNYHDFANFDINKLRSVADIMADASWTSTAVFVKEKQNLYIDEVKEVEAWATFLMKMDVKAWISNVAAALQVWTSEGLTYLIDNIGKGVDGALGFTSKPDIYTIYMRVILAANVLIAHSPQPTSWNGSEIENEHDIESLLKKLLEVGRQRQLHGLIVDRIERCLQAKAPPI